MAICDQRRFGYNTLAMMTAQRRRHHKRRTHLTPGHERRRDGLSIAVLWLLLALLLGKALLPDWVLLPLDIVNQTIPPWQPPDEAAVVHNPLLEDAVFYIYPVKTWTAAQVRQGELPLWSDQLFGGYPAIYDTQAGLFYPLSLLYYWLDGATAVDLTIFLQMGLGATFMFLYLRRLGLRRPAAILGAVVFIGNGLMVVWLEWQVVHAAIIWLPLALWAVERFVASYQLSVANPQSSIRISYDSFCPGLCPALAGWPLELGAVREYDGRSLSFLAHVAGDSPAAAPGAGDGAAAVGVGHWPLLDSGPARFRLPPAEPPPATYLGRIAAVRPAQPLRRPGDARFFWHAAARQLVGL